MTDDGKSAPELPPHPLDMEWTLSVEGTTFGPYSGYQMAGFIKEERVLTTSLVARVGSSETVEAKDDPTLESLFDNQAREASMKPPPAGSTAQHGSQAAVGEQGLVVDIYRLKSPGLAVLLSLLLCGAGQMYNERIAKGFGMLALFIVTWFVLLGWVVWIWSMTDAYDEAQKINDRFRDSRSKNPRATQSATPSPKAPYVPPV